MIDIEDAYDPDVAPDPASWLALDEEERLNQVLDYHRRAGISLPSENMHAVIHAGIENQIALGDELPVRRAIDSADGGRPGPAPSGSCGGLGAHQPAV